MSNILDIELNGVKYKAEWSWRFIEAFKQETGKNFAHMCSQVYNAVSQMEKYGYSKLEPHESHNEITERVTEVFDHHSAAHMLYNAFKLQNPMVTIEEIQDHMMKVGLNPNDGWQYVVFQYALFCISYGGTEEKKSLKPSLLQRLNSALFQQTS